MSPDESDMQSTLGWADEIHSEVQPCTRLCQSAH